MTRKRWMLLGGYLLLLAAGLGLSHVLPDLARTGVEGAGGTVTDPIVLFVAAVFMLACAIPFIPGVEIGFAMLMALGPAVAPLVWLATVAALCLAFAVGRLVPPDRTCAALRALGLVRAAELVADCAARPPAEREAALMAALPGGPGTWLARHRYLALAVLFNLPGNALLGGGGGIAFAAGASHMFHPLAFVALTGLAVAPVPIAFTLFG